MKPIKKRNVVIRTFNRTRKWIGRELLPLRRFFYYHFIKKLYVYMCPMHYVLSDGTICACSISAASYRYKPTIVPKILEQKDEILQQAVDDLRKHFNTDEPIDVVGIFCTNLLASVGADTKTYKIDRVIRYNEDGSVKEIKDDFTDKPKRHAEFERKYPNASKEFDEMLQHCLDEYDD